MLHLRDASVFCVMISFFLSETCFHASLFRNADVFCGAHCRVLMSKLTVSMSDVQLFDCLFRQLLFADVDFSWVGNLLCDLHVFFR